METVKIKPSHESQGDFVIINKDDFNPEIHEMHAEDSPVVNDAPVVDKVAKTAKKAD